MECKPVFLGLIVVVLCLYYGQAVSLVPKPPSECLQIACKCTYGTIWTTDANGCRRCSCKPRPVECPLLKCLPCPKGLYLKDKNGCQTCTCEIQIPNPVCPDIACLPGSCRYGFELDSNGCNTCTCKQCPNILCPVRDSPCPNGYAEDSNGCPTCDCKPSDCERVLCPMVHNCPFGFAKDSRGCQIGCECASFPVVCPKIACMRLDVCPNGFEKDIKGCPTCRCKTICPLPLCPAVLCPDGLGFEFDTDANGCKTNCRCKTRSPQCPSFHCRIYCNLPEIFQSRIESCACTCPTQVNA